MGRPGAGDGSGRDTLLAPPQSNRKDGGGLVNAKHSGIMAVLALLMHTTAARSENATPAEEKEIGARVIKMEEIKWQDAPPKFIKGAQIAVLLGDPEKAGMFIIRFKLPANYKVAPHTHPKQEHVTVLRGGLAIGMGTKMDMTTPVMPPGTFFDTPANKPHFVFTKEETITEVSGMGPFELTYLHPEDDPSRPHSH